MLLTIIMLAVLIAGFVAMIGLVLFAEAVITVEEPSADIAASDRRLSEPARIAGSGIAR
jgi:hypothetical protein